MESSSPTFRRTLAIVFFPLSLVAIASTYRFSPAGDDSRSAAEVASATAPWKSLSKLGSVALKPGDSILLERDGIWRETLRLGASGSQTQPIVVGSYGAGSRRPEIRGSQTVVGGGAVEHQVKVPGIVKGLFAQGQPVPLSRFPDTGWLVASSFEGDSALTSASLVGKDWVGASVHVRASMWGLGTLRVRTSQGGRISFPGAMGLPDSVRFYMGNHPAGMSGGRMAWWFSFQDSTLHWSLPGSTSDVILEAATREYGIHLGGYSNLVVEGIKVFATTKTAILTSGSNVRIENCEIAYPGQFAIDYSGHGDKILHNTVVGASENAVVGHGSGHRIEGNSVRRTAQKESFGPDGMGPGCCTGHGIVLNGDSSVIANNTVDSSGYCGISFFGRLDSIRENVISKSCLTIDDCGGIYTITGNYANAGSAGSVVRKNILSDAVGAPSGWAKYYDAAQGIYLDDGSHDILVDSNVVSGSKSGVFLHNNQRNAIVGNVLYGNRAAQILMQRDGNAGTDDMKANRIEGNTIVSRNGQLESQISLGTQTASPADWRGNVSCSDGGLRVVCHQDGRLVTDLERIGRDHPSLGPELLSNYGFDSVSRTWVSWPNNAVLSIESGSPCGGGKCLQVRYGPAELAKGPLVNSGIPIPAKSGQNLRLSFRSKGGHPGQTLVPVLRRSHTDYANLIDPVEVRIDTAWGAQTQLLRVQTTEERSRLDFHVGPGDSTFWLDDVSLREIPESTLVTLAGSRLFSNPGATGSHLDLQGVWIDPAGNRISSLDLAPKKAAVLFAFDGGASVDAGFRRPLPVSLRVVRESGAWRIEGLRAPATIHDVHGRRIADIAPDAGGVARWASASANGVHWVVARGKAVSFFIDR